MSVFISRQNDIGITGDCMIGEVSGLKGCKIRRADLTSAMRFRKSGGKGFHFGAGKGATVHSQRLAANQRKAASVTKVERYLFNIIKLPLILILILLGFIMEYLIELPFNLLTRLDARRGPRP